MLKTILFISLTVLVSNAAFAQPHARQITKGVVNGSAVSLPKPAYPAAAQAIKASGEVKVQVLIDEAGNVTSAAAISGHPLLRQAAEKAAREAKFKPTTLEGNPVKVSGVIVYNFVPADEPSVPDRSVEVWSVAMLFGLLEKGDDQILSILELDSMESDLIALSKELPAEMAKDKPLIEKLAKTKGAERQKLAGEVNRRLEGYSTGTELEVYRLGNLLGSIVIEAMRAALPALSDPDARLETVRLRSELTAFRRQLNTAKEGLSPDNLRDFNELAAYADAEDLGTRETLGNLMKLASKIMVKIDGGEDEDSEPDEKPLAPDRTGI